MGLDRYSKTPCGFCFIEYYRRADTEDAVRFLNSMKLDERLARVDWDGGFVEGRQYGRGRSGGQVRDEYRADFDAGRGGWGKLVEAAPTDRAPLPAPRRRTFEPSGYRGGPEDRRDDRGVSDRAPSSREHAVDSFGRDVRPRGSYDGRGDTKRSRVNNAEANPRFRADKGGSDDEDD
mmetsp:Transcript_14058/g.42893  ORF Transcript_14058/g.42893 Transcript_14058/m.42893 type:complete len:177 (-) Transcript_14058:295-825(-)